VRHRTSEEDGGGGTRTRAAVRSTNCSRPVDVISIDGESRRPSCTRGRYSTRTGFVPSAGHRSHYHRRPPLRVRGRGPGALGCERCRRNGRESESPDEPSYRPGSGGTGRMCDRCGPTRDLGGELPDGTAAPHRHENAQGTARRSRRRPVRRPRVRRPRLGKRVRERHSRRGRRTHGTGHSAHRDRRRADRAPQSRRLDLGRARQRSDKRLAGRSSVRASRGASTSASRHPPTSSRRRAASGWPTTATVSHCWTHSTATS
jgi:hypothetical protein